MFAFLFCRSSFNLTNFFDNFFFFGVLIWDFHYSFPYKTRIYISGFYVKIDVFWDSKSCSTFTLHKKINESLAAKFQDPPYRNLFMWVFSSQIPTRRACKVLNNAKPKKGLNCFWLSVKITVCHFSRYELKKWTKTKTWEVDRMTTSPTSGRPPNKGEDSSPALDLPPQELRKYLSQPVRAIFHEQAKSILAIQVRGFTNF